MSDTANHRLCNQQLIQSIFNKPNDVVAWLGAVQSQDYAGAKWALGLRLQGVTDADIEQAFISGAILRTHVMRPTWHFVTPADIRWMLELTAPRVNTINAHYHRKMELDDAIFQKSNDALIKALQSGKQLTRAELGAVLAEVGIVTEPLRLSFLMMRAELDGIICSGARRGKQFTYALLEERAPQAKTLKRDEALAELTRRYFTSHGPATVEDFSWWSGLTKTDVRAGLEMVKPHIVQEVMDGKPRWYAPSSRTIEYSSPTAHLLPPYDEYTVAYKDHSPILAPIDSQLTTSVIFNGVVAIDGVLVGNWKRTLNKGSVAVELAPFHSLTETQNNAVAAAAQRYGEFLNLPVVLA